MCTKLHTCGCVPSCTDETCMSADCTIMPLHFGVVEHSCRAE